MTSSDFSGSNGNRTTEAPRDGPQALERERSYEIGIPALNTRGPSDKIERLIEQSNVRFFELLPEESFFKWNPPTRYSRPPTPNEETEADFRPTGIRCQLITDYYYLLLLSLSLSLSYDLVISVGWFAVISSFKPANPNLLRGLASTGFSMARGLLELFICRRAHHKHIFAYIHSHSHTLTTTLYAGLTRLSLSGFFSFSTVQVPSYSL